MSYEIVRASADELSREVWLFSFYEAYRPDGAIRLQSYRKETRPSRRHKKWTREHSWGAGGEYGRCHRNLGVSIPPDVLRELAEEFIKKHHVFIQMAVPASGFWPEQKYACIASISDILDSSPEQIASDVEDAREDMKKQVDEAWEKFERPGRRV